ncbi:MAG TPA: glycoside hydrolase family 30 beta sandwich domain-containing protein [Polyangia bacterium]|jgi:glucosylceramidase|nr:glycoside hydrolase family 30 beta sandwich domain-containing protein [Polyangia bacterium]
MRINLVRVGCLFVTAAACSSSGGTPSGSGGGGGTTQPLPLPSLVTSGEGAYWKTDGQLTEVTSDNADVTVDDGAVAQRWDGFGGTFSERSADYLFQLSASDKETALQLLFGLNGLRFNHGRIPIGASDYAIDRYTLDETPGDTSMSKFSIERDAQKLIPYIKAALAVAPGLHLWASPWSPPTWMKSSGTFDGGAMKEDDATLQAFALYLTKFVQEYGKQGIPIEVVHPQKEPNLALDFPSCVWSAAGMTRFIGAYLGPMFAEQKVNAQIFLGSLSQDGGDGKARAIISAVMADATAVTYVNGFGFEWDGVPLVAAVKPMNLPIWQDNHNVGNLPWGVSFRRDAAPNDHAYAVSSWGFIRDWIRAGVDAYFTSSMILDSVGVGIGTMSWPQNALLVVDASSKQLVVTPAYHLFRHLSAYVEPGANVIGTSGGDALAFKNPDGTIVAVLYNSGAAGTTTVAMAGKKLQFEMPANGWATVKAK